MLTSDERRAALFLAAITALGGVMRVVRAPAPAATSAVVAPALGGDDIQRQAALARRAAALLRPLGPGETIDVDRAQAAELERLPGVGPALARRIVADRDAHGAFGALERLDEVPGIGPAMLASLRPHARFSGPPRPPRERQAAQRVGTSPRASARGRSTRRASP